MQALSEYQHDRLLVMTDFGKVNKQRLSIADSKDNLIAQDTVAFDLSFNPYVFWKSKPLNSKDLLIDVNSPKAKNDTSLLDALAPWPNIAKDVAPKLSYYPKSKVGWINLAWAITPEAASKINELHLNGIKTQRRLTRVYPQKSLYAHAVGFTQVSDNSIGQEGLEYFLNNRLIESSNETTPIKLSLDARFQKNAHDALQEVITKNQAIGGAVVLMDVDSNQIKVMVSLPDFDPNDASTFRNPYQPNVILNRATSLNFPIGDLLTPILAAHGLESGKFDLNTQFKVGGKLNIGEAELIDMQVSTVQTVEGVVSRNNDIAFSKMALSVPVNELKAITTKFGIGQPCRIAGMTCINQQNKPFAEWTSSLQLRPGNFVETNLIQALKAYTPFANDGEISIPRLLDTSNQHADSSKVISSEIANHVKHMLELSAKANPKSPFSSWSTKVAGKSTLIKGLYETNPETHSRLPRNDIATLIAILPADKPKYIVGVLLEFPNNKGVDADVSAAPVVANLMSNYLNK